MSKEVRLNKDGTVDKRSFNKGGVRAGSGRPKQTKKQALVTKMDILMNPDKALRKLKKIMYNDEDSKLQLDAIKLYMAYRFGRPVETKEVSIFKEQPLFVLNEEDVKDVDYDDIIDDIINEDSDD